MSPQDRFLIIAWPEDHEEELSDYARDIQSTLDYAQSGGARVIECVDRNVELAILEHHKEELP